MKHYHEPAPFSLVITIVARGQGQRIMNTALKHGGSTGGTIVPAHGTAHQRWLQRLRLDDIRREMVMMLVRDRDEVPLMNHLAEVFHFGSANAGICFSLPVSHALGAQHVRFDGPSTHDSPQEEKSTEPPYLALFAIVDQRDREAATSLIQDAGAPGATYLNAFGSANLTTLIFDVPSIDEKSLLLVVARQAVARAVVEALTDGLQMHETGRGIVYAMPVHHVRGQIDHTEVNV